MAPIQKLNASVHRVSQGDLNARVEITTKDEIGQLSQHFNQMLDHTQSLMNVIIEEQAAKRKADIASLQAQINPHFLYNTLTSIRYMSLVGKKEDVDTAILALNSILKCALSDTESFVSINMEMEQLKNYLIIAKYGFSVPLKVNMDIEPELGNCKTIKLILQPIVENAVIHGLKGNLNDPTLSIRVYSENDSVCFLVHDNGVGFDVSSLPKKKALSDSNHIGVHNVNARIQLYFGSDYGIHIESQPGTGTKVWVKIPKISGEGSICHEYFNR